MLLVHAYLTTRQCTSVSMVCFAVSRAANTSKWDKQRSADYSHLDKTRLQSAKTLFLKVRFHLMQAHPSFHAQLQAACHLVPKYGQSCQHHTPLQASIRNILPESVAVHMYDMFPAVQTLPGRQLPLLYIKLVCVQELVQQPVSQFRVC